MFVSVLTGGSPPPEPEIWGTKKGINVITALFYCCCLFVIRDHSTHINSHEFIFKVKQMLSAKQTTDINVDLAQILLYNTTLE